MISLWGIARTTIAEGIRMKLAVVFILLLMLILPTLPIVSHGDGTLKGRVQSFLNYSLTATWVLLSLLTIFMSCSTLANEIKNRQIYSLASKPVPRWKVLLGKWLGIIVLDVALLA
jgi:ABC-type transport system involved in multi-copper enzyme maturation permease subunit